MNLVVIPVLLVTLTALGTGATGGSQEFPRAQVEPLLPRGELSGELYRWVVDPECAVELRERWEFLKENPRWWLAVTNAVSRGDTVPFFEGLGLERGVFEKLVSCGDALSLEFLGNTVVRVTSEGQGEIQVAVEELQPEFGKLSFDLESGAVSMLGECLSRWRTDSVAAGRYLKGHTGVRWRSVLPGGGVDSLLAGNLSLRSCAIGLYEDGRGYLGVSSGANLGPWSTESRSAIVLYEIKETE